MTEIARFTGQYAWLSNFAPSPFLYQGVRWPTAEHAFQGMKHPDPDCRPAMAVLATPQIAKQRGRRIPIRHDWEAVKRKIMLEVLLAKFTSDGQLRWNLAGTLGITLIEGNSWHDTYWGAVRADLNPDGYPHWLTRQGSMFGENWLGRLLMMTREVLA
jgi:ribA/ribD-fused uncharacterized protein